METLQPIADVMSGLSLPVKIAWGVWLVWAAMHVSWSVGLLRRSRPSVFRRSTPARRAQNAAVRRAVAVKPIPQKTAPVSAYGTSDFVAALDQERQG